MELRLHHIENWRGHASEEDNLRRGQKMTGDGNDFPSGKVKEKKPGK